MSPIFKICTKFGSFHLFYFLVQVVIKACMNCHALSRWSTYLHSCPSAPIQESVTYFKSKIKSWHISVCPVPQIKPKLFTWPVVTYTLHSLFCSLFPLFFLICCSLPGLLAVPLTDLIPGSEISTCYFFYGEIRWLVPSLHINLRFSVISLE